MLLQQIISQNLLVDWVVGMGVNIPRSTLDTIAVIIDYIDFIIFHVGFWRISSKENRNEKI